PPLAYRPCRLPLAPPPHPFLAKCQLASVPPDADSDTSAPTLDASAATTTSARSLLHHARQPTPAARTTCEFHHNLAGHQIAAGFECCQTAPCPLIRPPLFWHHLGAHFFANHTQKGACPHRQGHMPIPARKRQHLVVSDPSLALSARNALFDRRAHPRYAHQLGQTRARARKGDISRRIARIADAPSNQQEAFPATLWRLAQLQAPPIVPAWPFRARA